MGSFRGTPAPGIGPRPGALSGCYGPVLGPILVHS
jgi:hypothetical protein